MLQNSGKKFFFALTGVLKFFCNKAVFKKSCFRVIYFCLQIKQLTPNQLFLYHVIRHPDYSETNFVFIACRIRQTARFRFTDLGTCSGHPVCSPSYRCTAPCPRHTPGDTETCNTWTSSGSLTAALARLQNNHQKIQSINQSILCFPFNFQSQTFSMCTNSNRAQKLRFSDLSFGHQKNLAELITAGLELHSSKRIKCWILYISCTQ